MTLSAFVNSNPKQKFEENLTAILSHLQNSMVEDCVSTQIIYFTMENLNSCSSSERILNVSLIVDSFE